MPNKTCTQLLYLAKIYLNYILCWKSVTRAFALSFTQIHDFFAAQRLDFPFHEFPPKSLGGLTLAAEKPAWDDGVSVSFVMLIHSGGAKIYKAIWFIVSPMKWGKIILKTPFVWWLEMPEIHLNGCWWWGLFHCLTPMTPMSAKINLDTSPSHSCSTRISMIAFPATLWGKSPNITRSHNVFALERSW